ncbi:MAG: glycosyltransferase [Rikenellaceae bacterium]
MKTKPKILISAYACEPNMGSEIGVGWHWVVEMSKYFDLWVLTRESNRQNIENYLADNPIENCPAFLYYDLPYRWRFWKKGLRGVRIYYVLWQLLSDKIVKRTMLDNNIKIYHHLTYGNALWNVSKYGQQQIFIWGPTSAGEYLPKEFTNNYGFKNRLKEFLQRALAKSLAYNIGFKSRCKDANLILCKTKQTVESIPEKYRAKAILFTDVAVEKINTENYRKSTSENITRFLAVGRLESWRGFDILIESFAKALKIDKNLQLDILGSGGDRDRLNMLIKKLEVEDSITLRGHLPREGYYRYMANCDVVVNLALKEGAVTTAFDSMSFAKPLICIDSGGYTQYFNENYAVVLQRSSRNEIIEQSRDAILKLTDKKLRSEMSQKIVSVSDNFSWEQKGREISRVITKYITGRLDG